MTIESLVAFGVITIGLLIIAIYADKHRTKNSDNHNRTAHSG